MSVKHTRILRPKTRLVYDDLQLLFKDLKDSGSAVEVTSHVISSGPAAAYALVWEFGNLRQYKQGPKTVLGVNPNGESVWLSSQAPHGYIRILSPQFKEIIRLEMAKYQGYLTFRSRGTKFNQAKYTESSQKRLEKMAIRITTKMLRLLRATVPVDEGDLRDSLKVFVNAREVEVGDSE